MHRKRGLRIFGIGEKADLSSCVRTGRLTFGTDGVPHVVCRWGAARSLGQM